MKKKFTFIHETGTLSPDTVFYCVLLGTSKVDQQTAEQCRFLSNSTDFYFKPHDAADTEFIYNVAVSLFPGSATPLLNLRTQVINGAEFRKMLRDRFFSANKNCGNTFDMKCRLDAEFYSKNAALWNMK